MKKVKTEESQKEKKPISFEEFQRLDLRVGVIRDAEKISGSKKLIKLTVEIGEKSLFARMYAFKRNQRTSLENTVLDGCTCIEPHDFHTFARLPLDWNFDLCSVTINCYVTILVREEFWQADKAFGKMGSTGS